VGVGRAVPGLYLAFELFELTPSLKGSTPATFGNLPRSAQRRATFLVYRRARGRTSAKPTKNVSSSAVLTCGYLLMQNADTTPLAGAFTGDASKAATARAAYLHRSLDLVMLLGVTGKMLISRALPLVASLPLPKAARPLSASVSGRCLSS